MQQWKHVILACSIFIMYLVVGAFIFRELELPHTERKAKEFFAEIDAFLASKPNLSKEEFYEQSLKVVEAVDIGVLGVNEIGHIIDGKMDEKEAAPLWDLPNSCFFCATIVTTIGYGDIAPQTMMGRIACIIYGTIGLPLTAWIIGVIARSLMTVWAKVFEKSNSILKKFFKANKVRKIIMTIFTVGILYTLLLQLPAIAFAYAEKWDTLTSVYYCFITMTTIGFGDLVAGKHPDLSLGTRWALKSAVIVYVLLGLSLLLALSSTISSIARKSVKKTIQPHNSYQLTPRTRTRRGTIMSFKDSEFRREFLANELVLFNSPDLSSATFANSSDTAMTTITEEGPGPVGAGPIGNGNLNTICCYGDNSADPSPQSTDLKTTDSVTLVDAATQCSFQYKDHIKPKKGILYEQREKIFNISSKDTGCNHVDVLSNNI